MATARPSDRDTVNLIDTLRKPLRGTTCSHIVPARHGFAFSVKAGSRFRVVDLHGSQVVDFMAWSAPYSPSTKCEHFSASYTQNLLGSAAPPAVGGFLYTNQAREMFEVREDTVKMHDMQYMACNPGLYDRLNMHGHRSCAGNVAEAMTAYLKEIGDDSGAVEWFQVHDPFNLFQNTPYYTMRGGMNPSRRGDYVEFEAKIDVVVALSACPWTGDGFNGGESTGCCCHLGNHRMNTQAAEYRSAALS